MQPSVSCHSEEKSKTSIVTSDCQQTGEPPRSKKRTVDFIKSEFDEQQFEVNDFHSAHVKDEDVFEQGSTIKVDKCGKFQKLIDFLPSGYDYMIDAYEELTTETFLGAPSFAFQALFWVNLETSEDVQSWIQQLQEMTRTTFRITNGTSHCMKGKKVIYKTNRHCQHKRKTPTRKMKKQAENKSKGVTRERQHERSCRDKNTDCPTALSVTLMSPEQNLKHNQHPCKVKLHYSHNHPLYSGQVLSFRPVSAAAKDAYHQLFQCGNSASSARNEYVMQLQLEHDDNDHDLQRALADRSINPNVQDVQRLFRQWREFSIGPENGDKMFERLEDEVNNYNKLVANDGGRVLVQKYSGTPDGTHCAHHLQEHSYSQSKAIQQQAETPFVLAIVTPLMARAHKLVRQAGELVFCDATASLDRLNTPVYIISTATAAGAIPLAVVMASGEDVSTMKEAFHCLKQILPSDYTVRPRPKLTCK